MPVSVRAGMEHRGRRRRGLAGPVNPGAIDGRIYYSTAADRPSPTLAHGSSHPRTNRYFHLIDQQGITSVQWYLGTNAASVVASVAAGVGSSSDANWVRNDATVPFDLKGGTLLANPLDLTAYAEGASVTVGCRIVKSDTSVMESIATFSITGGGGGGGGTTRIEHGVGRFVAATSRQGAPLPNNIFVPKPREAINLNRRSPSTVISSAGNAASKAATAGFTNLMSTCPLAWQGPGYNQDPAGSLAKLTAVANDDVIYNDGTPRTASYIYSNIAAAIAVHFPSAILRLGHEHNAGWYPWYSGSGRASLFSDAFTVAATAIRAAAPNIVIDFNIAHGGADPSGGTSGNDWTLDEDSFPADDSLYDTIGLDLYCRGVGRNLTVVQDELDSHEALGVARGKALSFPEIGMGLPDLDPTITVDGVEQPNPRYTGDRTSPHTTDANAEDFVAIMAAHCDSVDLAYFSWFFGEGQQAGQMYTFRPRYSGDIAPSGTGPWHPLTAAAVEGLYD